MNRITSFIFLFMHVISYADAQHKPFTLEWKKVASLPAHSRNERALGVAGPVGGIHNNVLMVAGGANFPGEMPWLGGKKEYYDELFVYEIAGDSLSLLEASFKLPAKIAYAASCSTAQGIVYAGGENDEGISKKAWLLQYNEKNKRIMELSLPDLPFALTNASIQEFNNVLYLAGGETSTAASNGFYSLDLNNTLAGWKTLSSLPKPVSHAVMVMIRCDDDKGIYLLGGRKKNTHGISDLYASVFKYDLNRNEWIEKAPLPYALSAGTGLVVGSYIVLFGGDRGETFQKTEALISAINAETDLHKKQALNQEKIALQSAHPGFSRDVLVYDPVNGTTKLIGQIPYEVPVTTIAVKYGNDLFIPSGEIRAGVRTPWILAGKLIFEE